VLISHNYYALNEESFDRNLNQKARHISNTHAVGQAYFIAFTAQCSHICLRVDRLLIIKLQPYSLYKSLIYFRQPNLLVYEAVILERVLNVGPP
jgi:hypothetical protein